jgi:RNA polymerase sigma factor (sigma-70 family)
VVSTSLAVPDLRTKKSSTRIDATLPHRSGPPRVRRLCPAEDQTGGGLANLLVASMTTPSRAFSRNQNQLQMLAALDTLPDEQREALRLRYLIGLPSKEVAKKMGKSDGAVRVMLTRSLTRLNEMLTG